LYFSQNSSTVQLAVVLVGGEEGGSVFVGIETMSGLEAKKGLPEG
jgi:hypothetical protein